ncbi:chemotaxis-specific protein-glutamate methyltransferase CheB [Halostella sp. JP-L12]|uniref:chemotaxis-specific protein-glutamate methyltransferase CheB n=1 Tax=Halostella TaxID=1843185 RepID=UPI000EF761A7|nr:MULTISPECIES: chemotaxis-specific protein-glutamate methyltransferase CheB [Halostella]NHN49551.1 chemotaxis-specific protein-glutamate methyltransferase CheB [Halostella sp. JP-L12]
MTSVLVVDDSQFMRTVIGNILSKQGYEVHRAADGESAVETARDLEPDLVTMDVEMPGMDGIEAVDEIMATSPTRILMLSAHTEAGADATLEALAKGAVDFMAKDEEERPSDVGELESRLTEKVRAVERADVSSVVAARAASRAAESAERTAAVVDSAAETTVGTSTVDGASGVETTVTPDIAGEGPVTTVDRDLSDGAPTIVIGASTGGPKVVERILYELPADLRARVLVVQHMPASFTDRLAARLDALSEYDVSEASHGRRVGPGEAVIAKGGFHMRVAEASDDELRLRLTKGERRHGVRPAIDETMESAADVVPAPLVGVALTGMGRDGAAGIEAIKQAGGATVAQDEASSPVFGIPKQAIETGCVDSVLDVGDLTRGIVDAATTDGDTHG